MVHHKGLYHNQVDADLNLSCNEITVYREIFASLNFPKNGNFNNFVKNIFANDPHGQHKRCGMVILLRNLISRVSKICEICENKMTVDGNNYIISLSFYWHHYYMNDYFILWTWDCLTF